VPSEERRNYRLRPCVGSPRMLRSWNEANTFRAIVRSGRGSLRASNIYFGADAENTRTGNFAGRVGK